MHSSKNFLAVCTLHRTKYILSGSLCAEISNVVPEIIKRDKSFKGTYSLDLILIHTFSLDKLLKTSYGEPLIQRYLIDNYTVRDAPRVKNPGGPVVMRHAAAARRRLLICQNLGGPRPPWPPTLLHAC